MEAWLYRKGIVICYAETCIQIGGWEMTNRSEPKPYYEKEKFEKSTGNDIDENFKLPAHKRETIWQKLSLRSYSKI